MVKFNPYKINPFKLMTILGSALKILIAASALIAYFWGAAYSMWDAWGWWALTFPVLLLLGFTLVCAAMVSIGMGYERLKFKYENAKRAHERQERTRKLEAQEARTTEMENDDV